MATGTDRITASPYPNGNMMVTLGPCSLTGQSSIKIAASWPVPWRCKVKKAYWCAVEGGTTKAGATLQVSLTDTKTSPQTIVAATAIESSDTGLPVALTVATHDDLFPGEYLKMNFVPSNASDVIGCGSVLLELVPTHTRPKATEK